MKVCIQCDTTGNIKSLVHLHDGAAAPSGFFEVEADQAVSGLTHYWDGERVLPYTAEQIADKNNRPSFGHVWAPTGWVDNRTESLARADLLVAIDIERERRNELPIQYVGSPFDADSVAQRNVSAWLAMVNAGQSPPLGFVWRDYDNVDHPADAAFITGLAAAITLRGTLLYQTAWAKKAEIASMTLEQLRACDPASGW